MKELFNAKVMLVRAPGKGGWTYAPVGEAPFKVKTHFGTLKVSGRVDDVVLENVQLMPMGQGRRFLPVNAALRKRLGKQAGDVVQVQLFVMPEEAAISLADFKECLAEVPAALRAFEALEGGYQQAWLTWVSAGNTEGLQVARIERAIALLSAPGPGAQALLPPA